jgi:hypothetical protein
MKINKAKQLNNMHMMMKTNFLVLFLLRILTPSPVKDYYSDMDGFNHYVNYNDVSKNFLILKTF